MFYQTLKYSDFENLHPISNSRLIKNTDPPFPGAYSTNPDRDTFKLQ